MPFEIIRHDITKMAVDAIVNTANPHPVVGAGTDSAIHKAAGPGLLAAREKIGDIMPGHSAATKAYDLQAKYVLHTVSPAWRDGQHRELELLRMAYDAALDLAGKLRCRSVAFPLMAAGSYGFPQEQALSVAIHAFTDFLLTHDMMIYLVIYNGEAFSLAGSLFDDLKSYIDDNYVSQHTPNYAPRRRRELEEMYELADSVSAALPPSRPLFGTGAAPAEPKAAKSTGSVGDLEAFLRQRESTFSEYLLDLLKERGVKDSDVYHRAQVSRQLFNKIINKKNYQPTKSTAIQLALALELDLNQTQKLLGKAGYALTRSSKADLVIQYFISKKTYSIPEINVALFDCGLPLLKTGTGA